MVNETALENETAAANSEKAPRNQVSKREVLDAQGSPQDEWIDAYGFSYTSLTENYEARLMFEELPDAVVRALAAFGGLTLAGNTTNTVRNGKSKGDATEKSELIAWIENLKAGNWSNPRGEVEAGLSMLSQAYAVVMEKAGAPITPEIAMEKLKAATKEKRAEVRKHPQVKAELARMIAERAAQNAAGATPAALPLL